jgi:peptide methionine sulfoxide reductase MsrB
MTFPPRESQENNNNYKQEPQRIWIRKKNHNNNEQCTLSLQAQHKKNGWYVDSVCSKNMTNDKDKFLTLRNESDGLVSFGNDNSSRIIGRGTVNIVSKNAMK